MSDTLIAQYDQTVNSEDGKIGDLHPSAGGQVSSYGSYNVNVSVKAKVTSCKFWLKKGASPSAEFIVRIYSQTGNLPNTLLATSDIYQVSNLTTSMQLIEFTSSGANQITLSPGTNYSVQCQAPSSGTLDATNCVYVGRKSDSTGDGCCYYASSTWNDLGTIYRPIYYLYGIPVVAGGAFLLNFI